MHNPEKLISPSLIRMIVDIAADQGMPEKDRRHLRSMAHALYRRWKDFSDVMFLNDESDDKDEKIKMRRRIADRYENILRDLIDFAENPRFQAPSERISIRDVENGRTITMSSSERSPSLAARGENGKSE
ncbi:hypothetical protein [Sphingobium scionense]